MKSCSCGFVDTFNTRRSCPLCGLPLVNHDVMPDEYVEKTKKELIDEIKKTDSEIPTILKLRKEKSIRKRLEKEADALGICYSDAISNEDLSEMIKDERKSISLSSDDYDDEYSDDYDDYDEDDCE